MANLLQPFQFAHAPVRGRFIRLVGLDTHIHTLKNTPPAACAMLAELTTLAALLVHDGGHELGVTLQIQHSPSGSLAFAGCTPAGELKAYANPAAQSAAFSALAQGGQFAVTLEPLLANGQAGERYQSLVELSGASPAVCLETYYSTSAQTPTRMVPATGVGPDGSLSAAVLLLQTLPGIEPEALAADDTWQRLTLLLSTVKPEELLHDAPEVLLRKLFAEDDLTLYPAAAPTYAASNPRPRMLAALAGLPAAELAELLKQGTVTLTDQTTGQVVHFTPAELAHLHDTTTPN
jgi:molecular chaperone Hsp33